MTRMRFTATAATLFDHWRGPRRLATAWRGRHGQRAGGRGGGRRGDRRHRWPPLVVTALIALADRGAPQRARAVARPRGRVLRAADRASRLGRAAGGGAQRIALLTAVLGMYWDISLHIDNGRDAGPARQPRALPDPVGLYGALLAGALTMALAARATERRRRAPRLRLVGARRRADDRGVRRLRPRGLPARRPLAPPLRPGRDALGAHPPDADRRRLAATLGAMALTTEAIAAVRGANARREAPLHAALRRAFLVGGFLVRCPPSRASSTSACPSSASSSTRCSR